MCCSNAPFEVIRAQAHASGCAECQRQVCGCTHLQNRILHLLGALRKLNSQRCLPMGHDPGLATSIRSWVGPTVVSSTVHLQPSASRAKTVDQHGRMSCLRIKFQALPHLAALRAQAPCAPGHPTAEGRPPRGQHQNEFQWGRPLRRRRHAKSSIRMKFLTQCSCPDLAAGTALHPRAAKSAVRGLPRRRR